MDVNTVDYLFKLISDPSSVKILLTVTGLGGLIKMVLIPLIKCISKYLNRRFGWKELVGWKTVLVVYIVSFVPIISVCLITKTPINSGLILLAWMATKDAIGLHQTTKAIIRPEEV
jgi:hypothetical protein